MVGWLVVGLSPIVRLLDLGLLVECPPWGSSYGGDPSPYLIAHNSHLVHNFHQKLTDINLCWVDTKYKVS